MKKLIFLLLTSALSFGASAQYLRMAKQGKVWYSQHASGGAFVQTTVFAIDGDTLLMGQTYPLLVEKDSSLNTTTTLAYLDEDTVAGTLGIHFFTANSNDQFYDFGLSKGDTVSYNGLRGGQPDKAVVDSVYSILDFNGITRKVLEFGPANPNSQCSNPVFANIFRPWVEGIGALGFLTEALPECYNGLSMYNVKCVFDGQTKIYGDTVSECYRQTLSANEIALPTVELFPNPVKNKLQIQSEVSVNEVVIYNMDGRLLLKANILDNGIDLTDLQIGVYILEMIYQDGTAGRYRVLKQ